MSRDCLTPESMKLNEVAPDGFTAAPRTISQEVAKLTAQMEVLYAAVRQLVDLQSEANKKLDAALSGPPIEGV